MRNRVTAGVMKTLGIFSGVQVVGIACSIVRNKLVALWIGAAGVGLFGLFYSALDTISTLVQMGVRNSAVPAIAASGSEGTLARISYVVRRWTFWLGVVGSIATMALSQWLSMITFGDTNHALGFIILALTIFLSSIMSGEGAILQGTDKLRSLASGSVWGAVGGLMVSLPLFYFFRINGIVPAILTYSVITTGVIWIMRRRTPRPNPMPTSKEVFSEGFNFVKLGIMMTISSFISLASTYAFMAYLNHAGGTDTVGLYQAGNTLANRYVSLMFVAISMEYFPRLCRVTGSVTRTSVFASHETVIAMLVIMPVATLFMSVDDIIVRLLYSDEFLPATPLITWSLAGTSFRALSFCLAYAILARRDGRLYLITESASAVITLALNIGGYRLGGLTGLGISYTLSYLAYSIIVGAVFVGRYRLHVTRSASLLTAIAASVTLGCAAARAFGFRWIVVAVGILSGIVCLKKLIGLMRG